MTTITRPQVPAFVLVTLCALAACGGEGEHPPPIGEGGNPRTPPVIVDHGGRSSAGEGATTTGPSGLGGVDGVGGVEGVAGDRSFGGGEVGGSLSEAGTFSTGGVDGSSGTATFGGTFSSGGT